MNESQVQVWSKGDKKKDGRDLEHEVEILDAQEPIRPRFSVGPEVHAKPAKNSFVTNILALLFLVFSILMLLLLPLIMLILRPFAPRIMRKLRARMFSRVTRRG